MFGSSPTPAAFLNVIPLQFTPFTTVTSISPLRASKPLQKSVPRKSPIASANRELWGRIRSAIPLSQAFADLLGPAALKQTGAHTYKANCPFHSDRTPSLHIDDSKHSFRCFGCGASGSIIDFEQHRTGDKSIANALRSLAQRYPTLAEIIRAAPQKASRLPTPAPIAPKRPRRKWRETSTNEAICKKVLADAVEFYEDQLWGASGGAAREYMFSRGLSEATLRAFKVGYAPSIHGWDAVVKAMKAKGHSGEDCVLAGIARRRKDDSVYDVLRARVVTPIFNADSVPISVAGRILPNGEPVTDRVPKYVNGPETVMFRKSEVLFGMDLAKEAERLNGDDGFLLIVEGYMDVLAMYEQTGGRVACVASMGAALSQKQLRDAYRMLDDPVDGRVIVNFDGDEAGITAAERLCDAVIPDNAYTHTVHIAIPPPGVKDPGEFLSGHGSGNDYVDYILEVALPWYEWRGRRLVLEELDCLEMEDEASDNRTFDQGLEEDNEEEYGKARTMIRLDESDQAFDFQISEDFARQSDELILAFGAPPELVLEDPTRQQRLDLYACKEVIEALAAIIDRAQRSMPGFNAAAVVQSWADALSRGNRRAITPLYRAIIRRAEDLAEPWKEMAPTSQLKWMSPPPWIVDELPRKKRRSFKQAMGLGSAGSSMDIRTLMADPRRAKKIFERIEAQEAFLIPRIKAQTPEPAKRLKDAPRRAAEEIVLRALVFATEADRLEALEKILEVMVRCEERGLPFWTSASRENLFEHLVNAEGDFSHNDMAAALEDEEWWNEEMEELFIPLEEESNREWQSLRAIEKENPVDIVESTALSIERMAGMVASRMALRETEEIVKKLSTPSEDLDAAEIERLLAKQIALNKAVNRTKYYSGFEEAEWKRAEEEHQKELEDKERVRVILKQLKTNSVPLRKFSDAEQDGAADGEAKPF